jgi:hypothetical protein
VIPSLSFCVRTILRAHIDAEKGVRAMKITVIFQDDEQGAKNLDIAYVTIAKIIAKYIDNWAQKELAPQETSGVERLESCDLHPGEHGGAS